MFDTDTFYKSLKFPKVKVVSTLTDEEYAATRKKYIEKGIPSVENNILAAIVFILTCVGIIDLILSIAGGRPMDIFYLLFNAFVLGRSV